MFWTAGCGDSKAPVYQNQRSLALMDACEAILAQKDDEALKALRQLKEMEEVDRFTSEVTLAVTRRKNRAAVMNFLQKGDYEGLRQFMREQMMSGSADSASILEKEIPEALQALALYCAKIPWEEPKAMEDALVTLDQYHLILSRAEVYRRFRENQQVRLLQLRTAWQKKRAEELCTQWEKSYFQGETERARQILAQWQREQPDHPMFAFRERFQQKGEVFQPKAEEVQFYAVALLLSWERLQGLGLQKRAVTSLTQAIKDRPSAQSPVSFFLQGQVSGNFSKFLEEIRKRGWALGSKVQKQMVVK